MVDRTDTKVQEPTFSSSAGFLLFLSFHLLIELVFGSCKWHAAKLLLRDAFSSIEDFETTLPPKGSFGKGETRSVPLDTCCEAYCSVLNICAQLRAGKLGGWERLSRLPMGIDICVHLILCGGLVPLFWMQVCIGNSV